MAVITTAKPLILTQYAENSATTEYTTPSSTKTLIDSFIATNISGGAITLTIYIITSGGSVGDSYKVLDALSIASKASVTIDIMKNQYLEPGDFISVFASGGSSIVIRCSGREVVTS